MNSRASAKFPACSRAKSRVRAYRAGSGRYDAIYADRSNVWANQGRTPEFIAYFSALVDRLPHARSLEIGCGEGFLLAARNGGEKFAVDLSIEAIRKAKTRADAHYSLALAERLPYSDETAQLY